MLEQLKSPSEFAMELVIHIIATVATVGGCANIPVPPWALYSCIFNMLGTVVTMLGGILTGLDRIRRHDMSFIQLGGVGITTSLFISDLSQNVSMREDIVMVSHLYEDVFEEPWAVEYNKVDFMEFNQGLDLVQNSLSGPIYKNKEGHECLTMELHSLSDLDIFKGWKKEVCFVDTTRGYWNPWDVSPQSFDDSAGRGAEFTKWLRRYGIVVSSPWYQFFGKGTFLVLSNLWDETKLITRGGTTVNNSNHAWNITDSGNTVMTVTLWKDLSNIL